MARAYPVLIRKDIAGSQTLSSAGVVPAGTNENGGAVLQIMDLFPSSSLRVPAYQPLGQTLYLGVDQLVWNDTLVAVTPVAGNDTMTANAHGLAAYMIDNVNNADSSNIILTYTQANAIAAAILGAAVAGTSLSLATINGFIQTQTGGGSSTLNGAGSTYSTGSVAGVLQILAGQVYKVYAGAVLSGASHAFVHPHTAAGSFITNSDADFRNILPVVDTGALHLSLNAGNFSKLIASTFVFNNPLITYTSGNAQNIDGTDVAGTTYPNPDGIGQLTGGQGAAVTVYDASGNVLTT